MVTRFDDLYHRKIKMSRSSSINTSGTGGSSSREHHSHQSSAAVLGECGYCGQTIVAKKHKFLPLECSNCRGVYHVSCLRGNKPQTLLGDQLFKFSCAYCSTMGTEICSRPYLHWYVRMHIIMLTLIKAHLCSNYKTTVIIS